MQERKHIGPMWSKIIFGHFLRWLHNVIATSNNVIHVPAISLLVLLSCQHAYAQNTDLKQLKAKAEKAVSLFKRRVAEGKDVLKLLPEMEKVKTLGEAKRFDEANALLDKILPLLQSEKPTTNKLGTMAAATPVTSGLSEIKLVGAPDHGIFDPSIGSDGTGLLYMSLSGVASTVPGGAVATNAVRTYLATSSDQGKSWQLAGVINPDIGVTLGRTPTNGRWQSEVSALVFDPQAPRQARWKLVWHQYLNVDGDRKFEHGWIAYKEAETPGALAKAKPVKLITTAAYDAVNDNANGWTRSPIAGTSMNKMQQLAPALQGCIVVTEPGLLSRADALYMSLVCYKSGSAGVTSDVVLLKCARPCDAVEPNVWSYAGTALTPADSQALGLDKFSASDLFSLNGKDYLTVSPVSSTPVPDAYNGCKVFRFTDIVSGKIERSAGRPSPVAAVSVNADSFNGACAFQPAGTNKGLLIGGILFGAIANRVDATFHVFRSNVTP